MALLAVVLQVTVGCSSGDSTPDAVESPDAAASTLTTNGPTPARSTLTGETTTPPEPAVPEPTSTVPATTLPETTVPTTAIPTNTVPTTAIPTATVRTTTATAATVLVPASALHLVPLAEPAAGGWGDSHSGYPATDLFASCGAAVVSPVDGAVSEIRTIDSWDPDVDNPATRGGRSVTILGHDGVRYYLSHLDEVDTTLGIGGRVDAGQHLGTVGLTGRTSACHVHFGISPPCPGTEWSVRRGVIPPAPYLDDWLAGVQSSPAEEATAWSTANPGACSAAMADPFAADG